MEIPNIAVCEPRDSAVYCVTIRVTYLASTLTIGMANEVSHLQCVFPPIAQCPVLIHLDLEVDRSYSFLLLSVQPTFML